MIELIKEHYVISGIVAYLIVMLPFVFGLGKFCGFNNFEADND